MTLTPASQTLTALLRPRAIWGTVVFWSNFDNHTARCPVDAVLATRLWDSRNVGKKLHAILGSISWPDQSDETWNAPQRMSPNIISITITIALDRRENRSHILTIGKINGKVFLGIEPAGSRELRYFYELASSHFLLSDSLILSSNVNKTVAIVGTGFVADYYMRSSELHPDIQIIGVYDERRDRLEEFSAFWKVKAFESFDDLMDALPTDGLVLNLTTPESHYKVSRAALEANHHVYSEKPLAMNMDDANNLVDFAKQKKLLLGGAPCSYLSEAAQTLGAAIRQDVCGTVRVIFAELDDGYITQAPYKKWNSESGAPWPFENEMRTGCTMEHAGYVLTWMIAMLGSIRSITAFSEATVDKKLDPVCDTPDLSIGILKFESGPVVRLTCTILAPRNHGMLVTGDKGTLELNETWDNHAKVHFRKRFTIRRRLMESPIPKRLRLARMPGSKPARRRGAAVMDYFLGPEALLKSISEGGVNRCTSDLALHTTEATLYLQNAGETTTTHMMQSRCDPIEPMEWASTLR